MFLMVMYQGKRLFDTNEFDDSCDIENVYKILRQQFSDKQFDILLMNRCTFVEKLDEETFLNFDEDEEEVSL